MIASLHKTAENKMEALKADNDTKISQINLTKMSYKLYLLILSSLVFSFNVFLN